MTIEEAKFILQAYRPDMDTTDDPGLKEALQLLEESVELQSWFEEEKAFDDAFSATLSNIDIPPELESQILNQVIEKPGKIVEFPWWKQFSVLGAAASILLVLGLILAPIGQQTSYEETAMSVESFQSFASNALKNATGFNAKSREWATLVSYLNEHDTPAPTQLPGKLNEMPPVGCMTLKYNAKPVGVVCFGKNSKSHLFVINSEDFPDMPEREKPVLEQNPYSTTAYWTKNDRHYLLMSTEPKELSQFVSF